MEEEEWYGSFKASAQEVAARLKTVLAENRDRSGVESALETTRRARILASDPAFNFNRAGREKRTYLAEKLFPECDHSEIYRIVDEATNIDWIKQQRSSD